MGDSAVLFPIGVDFTASCTLCQLAVPEVRDAEGGAMPHNFSAQLGVESYQIV